MRFLRTKCAVVLHQNGQDLLDCSVLDDALSQDGLARLRAETSVIRQSKQFSKYPSRGRRLARIVPHLHVRKRYAITGSLSRSDGGVDNRSGD